MMMMLFTLVLLICLIFSRCVVCCLLDGFVYVSRQLFTRALDAENVGADGVVMVHPTCGPTQADDIPGDVR